ncbi:sigma-70 family RNA polymerase sigma factor [Thalassoglobus sp. JC818]|uniref:RNA polymerase sigma factor n=1 Tax=Thalassoglobus sp. JC818 TaxID=3232136 RepID=UPI00345A8B24
MDSQESFTSPTLLRRLSRRERDESAWREFVNRYGVRIRAWCLKRRLNPTDADDVTQDVLLRLAKYIEKFDYDTDQSFRGWLRRITENSVRDFVKSQRKLNEIVGTGILLRLDEIRSPQSLVERLEEVFDLELLEEAKSRVSSRVNSQRWLAWQLTAQDGVPANEVATRLGMPIATVYSSRFQIQEYVRQEIEFLEGVSDSS